jgi:peptide/nickel transport system permease protein
VIAQWIANHGYDRPLFWNPEARLDTLFVDHYRRMLTLDLGRSDADDAPIGARLRRGLGPTLSLTLPILGLGVALALTLSVFVAYFRDTYIDRAGVALCVLGMSVSILLYIIGGQYLVGKLLRWFPISGFDPSPEVIARFVALPALVGVLAYLGADVRFYRTALLEETNRDYVRTARAKGAGDLRIMVRHVLRNALIPVLTSITMMIPFLFTGSILLESFFGIPGLGAITVTAIKDNDFSTLRAVVFIGALIFIAAQVVADLAYTLVDPRVRLE